MAGQIAGLYQQIAALLPGRREQLGEGLPGAVVAALRKVPRHLFTPGVPLARAYAYEDAVVVQAGEGSADLSPVSAPSMIAGMLAQLDVRPGGPHGAQLAERLAGHIRDWDRDHRGGPGPVLTVHPAGTPADGLPSGHVLNKRHSTIVLSWPEPAR